MAFIKHILTVLLGFGFLTGAIVTTFAASTGWEDLGGGKARLHAVVDPVSNRVEGAIEIVLEPGWTTYWRYPGSSGIPPHFDFNASSAIGRVEVKHPAPRKMGEGDRAYAGYKSRVAFPFSAPTQAGKNPAINLSMLIGVCEEICIPARAEFKIPELALLQTDLGAKSVLTSARLTVPKLKPADLFEIVTTELPNRRLEIEIKSPDGFGEADLFVEGPNEWHLLPAERGPVREGKLIFELDISDVPEDEEILNKPLRYTLSNGTTGIEFLH